MKSLLKPENTNLAPPVAEATVPKALSARSDVLLTFCFCSVVLLITVLTFALTPDSFSDDENRRISEFPKFNRRTISTYPAQIESFFNDRVAFRRQLVKLRNLVKYRVFGTSTSADVCVGKDGFLFFTGEDMRRVCREERPFSIERLAVWKAAVEKRQTDLARRGIKFLFVVAPEKPSVYPEKVPMTLGPVRRVSAIDQLSSVMQSIPGKPFVDLRKIEMDGRTRFDTYFRTDTHWNAYGALLGYHAIVERLNEWFPQIGAASTADQVQLKRLPYADGDQPRLLGLAGWVTESAPQCDQAFLRSCPPNILDKESEELVFERNGPDARGLPVALVLHDSFGIGIRPYLWHHFRKIIFRRETSDLVDEKIVAKYKPDVVIQLFVERRVSRMLPNYAGDWRDWLRAQLAERAGKGAKWLNVLPRDISINANALQKLAPASLQVTTSRSYSNRGDTLKFSPARAEWYDCYLLKTGDQGFPLSDASSKSAYDEYQKYVATSGRFTKVSEFNLPDKETLGLYVRKP